MAEIAACSKLWVALGTLAVMLAATLFLFAYLAAVGVRDICRRTQGNCVECGYDLTGLPAPRCPECGHDFAASHFSRG